MGRAVEVDKERTFWIAFDYREKDQMIIILDCVRDRQRWRSSISRCFYEQILLLFEHTGKVGTGAMNPS